MAPVSRHPNLLESLVPSGGQDGSFTSHRTNGSDKNVGVGGTVAFASQRQRRESVLHGARASLSFSVSTATKIQPVRGERSPLKLVACRQQLDGTRDRNECMSSPRIIKFVYTILLCTLGPITTVTTIWCSRPSAPTVHRLSAFAAPGQTSGAQKKLVTADTQRQRAL